ncbi:MAG: hypothetical protein SVX43_04310 [Cyanobacteriota bacterium]|nr:hypothetical protein [Cyanobacteriota bacterium]
MRHKTITDAIAISPPFLRHNGSISSRVERCGEEMMMLERFVLAILATVSFYLFWQLGDRSIPLASSDRYPKPFDLSLIAEKP